MQTAGLCSLSTPVKSRWLVEDPSAPAYFQQESTLAREQHAARTW